MRDLFAARNHNRHLLLAGALTLVTGAIACSPATAGVAQPSSSATVSPAPTAKSTKSLDPCQMLGETSALGLKQGVPSNDTRGVGARTCDYGSTTEHGTGVSVDLWDNKGIDELNFSGQRLVPFATGKHQGKKIVTPSSGQCEVFLSVGPHSVADVGGSTKDMQVTSACRLIDSAANALDRSLSAAGL